LAQRLVYFPLAISAAPQGKHLDIHVSGFRPHAYNTSMLKAGGVIGIFTSFIAFYIGLSELLAVDGQSFALPLGVRKKRPVDDVLRMG